MTAFPSCVGRRKRGDRHDIQCWRRRQVTGPLMRAPFLRALTSLVRISSGRDGEGKISEHGDCHEYLECLENRTD